MTINEQTLEGSWNELKGRVREEWGEISNDELESAKGSVDRIVGLIQRKTGEGREAVLQFIDEATRQTASGVSSAATMAQDYGEDIADAVQSAARSTARKLRDGYAETERMVQTRPAESMAACFGIGLITGIVACLALRSR